MTDVLIVLGMFGAYTLACLVGTVVTELRPR